MVEIYAYGPVGWSGFMAQDLLLQLRGREEEEVLIRVHSDGGDSLEGLAIANVIRAHRGKVTVQVDGLCASAATPMLCTADRVIMAPGALVMLHEVRARVEGDAAELRAQADVVDKLNQSYRTLYTAKTGLTDEAMAELVKKNGWAVGSWLTDLEAIDLGLADELGPAVSLAEARPQARLLNSPAARFYTAAKGQSMKREQIALRERLGLPADASSAQVRAALAEMEKAVAEHEEPDGDEPPPKKDEADEPEEDEEKEKDGDTKALRAALAEKDHVIKELRAKLETAPKDAEARERKVRADVDQWVKEGRIAHSRRDHFLALHRKGEAWGVVQHLEPGTETTGQRLRSGKVGTRVDFETPPPPPAADDPATVASNMINGSMQRASRAMGLKD